MSFLSSKSLPALLFLRERKVSVCGSRMEQKGKETGPIALIYKRTYPTLLSFLGKVVGSPDAFDSPETRLDEHHSTPMHRPRVLYYTLASSSPKRCAQRQVRESRRPFVHHLHTCSYLEGTRPANLLDVRHGRVSGLREVVEASMRGLAGRRITSASTESGGG